MIRTITRVCLATAAVLLLAAPTKAANLRRAQAVATEGKCWGGRGRNEKNGGLTRPSAVVPLPRAEPDSPNALDP